MMRPPPEAFALARPRRDDSDGPPAFVRMAGWTAAAGLTLGLHAGLYVLLTRTDAPASQPPPMPAAVMINLAPIVVAARSETDNASPEAPSEASERAPPEPDEATPPSPALDPVVDVPPPPPAVVPQAVLPPKPPEMKPPEMKTVEKERPKKPIEKKVVEKPRPVEKKQPPRVATRAGGGPRSDLQTSDVTAASAAGNAVSEASRASWHNEVRARMVRAKRFPSEARGLSGVVVVSVAIGAGGAASGVRLVSSSGNAALDGEAMAAMYRAAPYPAPPGGRTATLTVPLNFRR